MFSILKRVSVVLVAQSRPTLCDPIDYSRQALLSIEFCRQEYWSELPFPSPGDLPHPGNEPRSPALQAETLPSEPAGKPKCVSMCVLVAQSRLTLCNLMDCSLPGSSIVPHYLFYFSDQSWNRYSSCHLYQLLFDRNKVLCPHMSSREELGVRRGLECDLSRCTYKHQNE